MDEEIREMLGVEIVATLNLIKYAQGEDDRSLAIEDLVKLYKLKTDDGMSAERLERERLAEQAKDRCFRLAVDVVGLILPLIFYGVWLRRGMKFEETGTFTSTTFRGLFNRFKPTNK